MKISIEKIRNWNSVIQFVVLIVFCVFVLVQGIIFIINKFPRNNNSGIQIVKKESKIEIKKSVKYNTLLRDTYVFSLESNAISESDVMPLQKSMASNVRSPVGKEIVNLYFVSDKTKKETQLFEKDNLIASYQFINDSKVNGFIFDKNIYAIVARDTNTDKRLSNDDSIDLYASDYNGLNLKRIANNIYSYQIINDYIVLFSEVIDNKEVFKTWNSKSDKIEIVKTIDEIPENKEINPIYY